MLTSGEKLILENQAQIMMALSVLLISISETTTRTMLVKQTSRTLMELENCRRLGETHDET